MLAVVGWILIVVALIASHLVANAHGTMNERARCASIARLFVRGEIRGTGLVAAIESDYDPFHADDGDDDGGEPAARPA
jgi:hypothetical protein